jgi:hypothetical protein
VCAWRSDARVHLVVRTDGADGPVPPGWEVHPVDLEGLTLAYLREAGAVPEPGPVPAGSDHRRGVMS